MDKKRLFLVAMIVVCFAAAAEVTSDLAMDRVYQGKIRLPDFPGRDRNYSSYKTKILNEMKTGPNFAGHYAIVEIGCGTSCRFAFVGDVSTGQVFDFPYGGDNYYQLSLRYGVKNRNVSARWIEGDSCIQDSIEWDGKKFTSTGKNKIGPREKCE